MATRGEVATAVAAADSPDRARSGLGLGRPLEVLVFAASVAALLGLWEFVSRTGLISQTDLPAMTTTFEKL